MRELMGVDIASLAIAVATLEREIRGQTVFTPTNHNQAIFFDWLRDYQHELEALTIPDIRVSIDEIVLNNFMERGGFGRPFQPIDDGVGVASIIKVLTKWASPLGMVDVPMPNGTYVPGFALSPLGCTVYRPTDTKSVLARLFTTNNISYWIWEHPKRPQSEMDLFVRAHQVMQLPRTELFYEGVEIPFVTARLEPDLTWLLGARAGDYQITQAFERLQVILNETTASTQVGTGVVAEKSPHIPYYFNHPFAVWCTEEGSNIPVGVVWVGEGAMGIRSEADVPFVS